MIPFSMDVARSLFSVYLIFLDVVLKAFVLDNPSCSCNGRCGRF